MQFDYAVKVASLSPGCRLHFYEHFAHNLTIAIRMVWSERALTAEEKLDGIRWINEIEHRVTARIWKIRRNEDTWDSEAAFARMIEDFISQNPAIGQVVEGAAESSFATARRAGID